VKKGDIILVVDVGGGTTDLSLIAVLERDGKLELHRVAVGEHILLGGDNMDLALAYGVARKLAGQGTTLDPWQTRALAHACRVAKETLLADASIDAVPVVVPSRGSKLIGGSIRTEVTRDELTRSLLDGFFPEVAVSDAPISRARGALTQLGLPYAQDAAITRHLGAFLSRQRGATAELEGFAQPAGEASFLHPTAVLFNGGVLKSGLVAERLLGLINRWLAAEGAAPARLLGGTDLDLAVARGAAYYGYVRRGRGVRIRGGTAQAYYVAVESAMPAIPGMEPPVQALCLAPSAWKKAPTPRCRPSSSGWWWASRCASASSARRCAATTRWAPCSTSGRRTNCRSSRRSRPACPPKAAAPATSCRCTCTPASPRPAPSSSKPCRWAAASAGRWSSTCAARRDGRQGTR
jgi:hypothetical protein